MGETASVCSLSNLSKFKCYTQSGSKKVYEDDGLTKTQSFIIFPTKTTLSTGECEYTIGLTGKLEDQHPWIDWTYTPPSGAVVGTTYSYKMTGDPIILSNYKGALVTGIPTKKWTWDIATSKTIITARVSKKSGGAVVRIILTLSGDYSKLGNDTPVISVYYNKGTSLLQDIQFTVNKSKGTYIEEIDILEEIGYKYSVVIYRVNPSSGAEWKIIPN